ncbi:putative nucleic-acid-binding Zn-ribbon protein [Rhizobium sp. BK399]|nr:putative nucleic-acid-binding Zn-ribbon protein [Rhizobium sp. BK399]
MPEIHPFKRLRAWTLLAARDQGQLISITCDYCRVTHRYLATDLIELCGNVTLDKVLRRFRCERCGKKNYLNMTLHVPHGSEFGDLPIRRLREVRTTRIPVWCDDLLR